MKFVTGGMSGEDPWFRRWRGRRWVQIGLSMRRGFPDPLCRRILYRFQTLYQWVGDLDILLGSVLFSILRIRARSRIDVIPPV